MSQQDIKTAIFCLRILRQGNVWQYLISVCDGKESRWEVIHRGFLEHSGAILLSREGWIVLKEAVYGKMEE